MTRRSTGALACLLSASIALALAGCGSGGGTASESTAGTPPAEAATPTSDPSTPAEPAPTEAATVDEVQFPLTFEDCGREVTLDQRPERILTMGSTAALLMWAAGATDAITTRASEGNAPLGPAADDLASVPIISADDDLSQEVIIGEDPDLVISYGLNLTTPEDLEAAGIASVVNAGFCDGTGSGPNADGRVTFEEVFADIELYGRIAGTQDVAERAVADYQNRVAAVESAAEGTSVTTAAALTIGDGPQLTAYGVGSMQHTQLEKLGLTNVFDDIDERLADISTEELLSRNPDVIVLLDSGLGIAGDEASEVLDQLNTLPGAGDVTAIAKGQVIPLGVPYLLGSPLAVDGLEIIAEQIAAYE